MTNPKQPTKEPQLKMSQGHDEVPIQELSRQQKEHHASTFHFGELYQHCVKLANRAEGAYVAGKTKLEEAKRIIGENYAYFDRLRGELNNPGRREKIEGIGCWQEFLSKHFSWCSLATAKRALKEMDDEWEQLVGAPEAQKKLGESEGSQNRSNDSDQAAGDTQVKERPGESEGSQHRSDDAKKTRPIKLTEVDRDRLLKAARIGGRLAEKHKDEPEAQEYLAIANQAPPLFGTDPTQPSPASYESLAASLYTMATTIADLDLTGRNSAGVHANIKTLKGLAGDVLRMLGSDYPVTAMPSDSFDALEEAATELDAPAPEEVEPVAAGEKGGQENAEAEDLKAYKQPEEAA
jgi:hypothetical protein